MLELGRMQTLEIVKEKDFGVYLGEPGKSAGGAEKGVLLPKKQVPEGAKIGDSLEVFYIRIRRTGSLPPPRGRSSPWERRRCWR